MQKFQVGNTYTMPGLHTISYPVKIVERSERTITYRDVSYDELYTANIVIVWGHEAIQAWEYSGEIGYMSVMSARC